MNFAEAAKMNAVFTRTENGAVALNTTGDARLDFFGTAGSLRGADKERVTRLGQGKGHPSFLRGL